MDTYGVPFFYFCFIHRDNRHDDVHTGRLAATSSELQALQAAHEETSAALTQLREQHAAATAAKEALDVEMEQLRSALQVREPQPGRLP